jgi:3alpha(or 20beta)-hydroxysteroid dehydrogenase
MARVLAAAGAAVAVTDVQDDVGAKVAEALGEGHLFVHLDVTDDASWEAAVGEVVGQLGGLDVLVNNAGVEITSLLVDLEPDGSDDRAGRP